MKWIILILGVIGLLLGGLWMMQGLDLVRIEPIACVGACEPIEGGSAMWAVIGLAVFVAGAFGVFRALRWRRA